MRFYMKLINIIPKDSLGIWSQDRISQDQNWQFEHGKKFFKIFSQN